MKKFKAVNNKKIAIILIFVMLFSFILPKTSKAAFEGAKNFFNSTLANLVYDVEFGVLATVNNIFCGDEDDVDNVELDKILLTPENIIKGKFSIFDANLFKDMIKNDYIDGDYAVDGKNSLKSTIAGWYYALRNLSLIALLSILVYIAIRMMLSSIAKDKEKYKSMLKDWLVAMILVVVMHFIIIFALNLTSQITEAIGNRK